MLYTWCIYTLYIFLEQRVYASILPCRGPYAVMQVRMPLGSVFAMV